MQAYKLKGKIDSAGNLVVAEPVKMPPGDVEIILLQTIETIATSTSPVAESEPNTPKRKFQTTVKAFQGLFNQNTIPEPPDFDDPDKQAKWEYLKEKHNL